MIEEPRVLGRPSPLLWRKDLADPASANISKGLWGGYE
jgi:hypothetical protein